MTEEAIQLKRIADALEARRDVQLSLSMSKKVEALTAERDQLREENETLRAALASADYHGKEAQ